MMLGGGCIELAVDDCPLNLNLLSRVHSFQFGKKPPLKYFLKY